MAPKTNKLSTGCNAPDFASGRHLFCGEDHHRTDPTYVWSSVDFVSTTPPTYHMMHFQSEVDMLNFSSACSEIRFVIDDINWHFQKIEWSQRCVGTTEGISLYWCEESIQILYK